MGGPLQSTFPGTLGWPPTWAAHTVLCVFPSKLALGMFLTFHSPPRFSLHFGFLAPQEQEPFLTLSLLLVACGVENPCGQGG